MSVNKTKGTVMLILHEECGGTPVTNQNKWSKEMNTNVWV